MGTKQFECSIDLLVILALVCHCGLSQKIASQYLDPKNYHDYYNYLPDPPTGNNEQQQMSATGEDTSTDIGSDCWFTLDAAGHFKAMDDLDQKFQKVRANYDHEVGQIMDRLMLEQLLNSRGAAARTVHKFGGDSLKIPAGLNLGGYKLLRLPDSILFFHRMKLRNSTIFTVNYLHNDLKNMALLLRLGLHDLHLEGAYERSATHKDPSILYYAPSYGTVQILMKNVNYKMDARLRMMSDRLTIELVTSELLIDDDILMSYLNTNLTSIPEYTVKMQRRNLDDFLQNLKTDLDLWLKDYFNDFLMYFRLPPSYDSTEIQEYEKKKTLLLNEYVNYAVNTIRQKIYKLGGHSLKLPKFTLFSVPNMVLRIHDGVLRGIDSMYRRSVATGKKNNTLRIVDVIIGFSNLKAEYRFEAVLPNGAPPLTGFLVLSANELTAHMEMSLVKDPVSLDLNFDFVQQMKPPSLTVEGSANRVIANFKHQFEHHIISLMANALMHNIKMLNTITRCAPFIYGYEASNENNIVNVSGAAYSGSKNAMKTKMLKTKNRRPIGRNKSKNLSKRR